MATSFYLLKNPRKSKTKKVRSKALEGSPFSKGTCVRVLVKHPKKPNSAHRKVARVRLSNGKFISAAIPGENHNLQVHSTVMVRGGRVRDLPGVSYKILRGMLDANPCLNRTNKRSKLGTPKPRR